MTTEPEVTQSAPTGAILDVIALEDVERDECDVRIGLRESLSNLGQRQPIKVRRRDGESLKKGRRRYVLVEGRHRCAALADLGRKEVWAVIEPLGGGQKSTVDRAEETLSTIVRERNLAAEADAVARLLEAKRSVEDIAERTGVPLRTVKELAAMQVGLIPEAFEKVRQGKVARAAAKQMLRLTPEAQRALVDQSEQLVERDEPGGAPHARPQRVRIKDVQSAVRAQRNDMFAQLDQVETPTISTFAGLADQVDAAAMKFAGDRRKLLVDAAAVLREGAT